MTYTYTLQGPPIPLSRIRSGRHRGWDASKQIEFSARNALETQSHEHSKFVSPIAIDVVFNFLHNTAFPTVAPHKQRDGKPCILHPSISDLFRFIEEMGTGILWHDPKIIACINGQKLFAKSECTIINITVL